MCRRNNWELLDVFRSTVEVMLTDGVLTREEKRLIIKLASALKLKSDEPAYIYRCIQSGELPTAASPFQTRTCAASTPRCSRSPSSTPRFLAMNFGPANLRDQFNIEDQLHEEIEHELRETMKEKYGDKAMIDTLMDTLKDSVGLVGDLFDTFRKKSPEGDER